MMKHASEKNKKSYKNKKYIKFLTIFLLLIKNENEK